MLTLNSHVWSPRLLSFADRIFFSVRETLFGQELNYQRISHILNLKNIGFSFRDETFPISFPRGIYFSTFLPGVWAIQIEINVISNFPYRLNLKKKKISLNGLLF